MDVRMPDGTIITGVPDNITQADLLARYSKYTPAAAPQPASFMDDMVSQASARDKAQRQIFGDSIGPFGRGLESIKPSIKPATGPTMAVDAMGNPTGMEEQPVEQPQGIAALGAPKPPSELAMGEELGKGAGAGVVGLKSMWENAGVMKDVAVLGTVQQRLDLFGKIDQGAITDFGQLQGLDLTTSQARSYLGATPEMREKMKERLTGEIGRRTDFVKSSISTLAEYQKEMQQYKGRTTDLTDVEGAKDFANWLAYNVGSGAVQMAPIMIAAATTGPAGVAVLGTGMGVTEAVGNRMQSLAPKLEGLNDDQKAAAVIDYVTKTGDTNLAVGIISGAFDTLLGPAAALAKRGLSQVVKGETRKEAAKAALKEVPKQMGEEFIAGGAQEATQIAGAIREGEVDEFLTKENAKKIFNAAAAEAAGALGGSGISGAARVYGAGKAESAKEKPQDQTIDDFLKQARDQEQAPIPPSSSPVVSTTKVNVGGKESTKTTHRDGSVDIDGVQVAPPVEEAAAPTADLVKETIPEADTSQDYDAMLAELESQLEGEPAPAKEEQAAEEPKKPSIVNQLAREEQARAGWNEDWPFVPVDLTNADFRKLIAEDPSMSMEEKQQIFDAGKKLGVISPKEQIAAPVAEEPSITELKSEEPVTQTAEPKVAPVETEMTPQERLRRANVSMFNAQRMLANGQITADQYDDLNRQYAEIKLRASDIAQRAAKPIVPAVEPKGEYQETKSLDTFFAKYKEDKKRLDDLPKYGQPEVKQTVADLNQAIQKVTDAINAKGYSADAIKHKAPSELRPFFDQFSVLTGGGSRLLMESERVGNNKKLANPEKLAKAIKESQDDIVNAYKLLGIEPEVTQPPAAPSVTAAKPARKVAKETPLRQAAYDKNPLMTFLASRGLYHAKGKPNSMKSEFSPDKAIMVSGYGPVFKASGMQLDEMLPIAIEYGYLPQDATESDLSNLIRAAISGKKVEPLYSEQGVEDTAAKYEERMAEEESAYEERAGQSDAEWYGMAEEEYMNMMASEVAELSPEEMAELNASVAEFNEVPASNVSVRAAMEAMGFTEQEIQDEENRTAAKTDEAATREEAQSNEPSEAAPALELKTQTAEELKAKQAEVDRLTKENERLSKQAEAKAKADAERDEFVLTGSDRAADVAAAQGQQDIFGAAEEESPAAEVKPAKGTVTTPDGAVLRYPVALDMVNNGYKVLALDDPRTYVDKGGTPHRTFEKGPLRISMTPQRTLFQSRNSVVVGFGNEDEMTLEALLVDADKRNQGLATQAMQDVVDAADKNNITLYLEPAPLVNLRKNDLGLDRSQLETFYNKFGFEFSPDSDKVMQREPQAEVLPAAEPQIAGQIENEPFTFEGEFTEIGEEQQRTLITDQTAKLSDAQVSSLEKFYGFARDTQEFADAVRQDVVNFITKGAEYVNGKIRAIIRSMANGVLSVAVAFNPQFVSQPYTIGIPQYETRIEQVLEQVPAEVQDQMSEDAKRAYATIYPAIKGELTKNDKFFIVADKQTANMFVFNPDGSPFMASKTLIGAGIGDFIKGDNNIVSNKITPAGLFDLGLRDAKRSVNEAATAGEYDFGKVFVLDKSQKGANGFYSTTIMHSVWTKEADAKQRLAALQKPGAEDSRYSFGCINVDKATYGQLVTNNLAQMDGAKIFIVPENGKDVMSFVNGEATYSTDIIRQRTEPVTKETKVEVDRAEQTAAADRAVVGREEEGPMFYNIEPASRARNKKYVTQDEIYALQREAYEELQSTDEFKNSQQLIKTAQEENNKRYQAVAQEAVRLLKEDTQFRNAIKDLPEESVTRIAMTALREVAEKNVPMPKLSEHDAVVAQNKLIEDFFKSKNIPEPREFSNQANQDRSYYSDPRFKKWFKNSKAVNKNGQPLVAFHTTDKNFTIFNVGAGATDISRNPNYTGKLGSWFTAPSLYDAEYEAGNAENAVSFSEGKEGDNTMLVHLSIQNPMEYEGFEDLQDDRNSYSTVEKFKQALIAQGYDGVVVRNSMTDGNVDRDDWVAFYPTQIKSAIGNRGTYDESGSIVNDFSTKPVVAEEKKRSPSFKRRIAKLNRDRVKGKISDEQFVNEADFALKQAENDRLEKPVAERVRGGDFIRQKLLEAKRKGDLSEEAVDLAEWFIQNNEQLVDDLGISIRSPNVRGVGGQYSTLSRVIILMKDAGSNLTVVHEILHHLERMMPPKVQQAIRAAWAKQLLSAQKKAKTPAEQLYFKLLVDAHYGDNNFDFVDVPEGEMSKAFMTALAELRFENPGSTSSIKLAEILLKTGAVPYQQYQFFNPSEFWAVNGADIVKGRFDAVRGGVLARLKNWLKELMQKLKGLVGMNSNASIIKALDSLSKGDGQFVTQDMLGEGEYKNVRRNYEGNEAPAASWESPEESKMDNWIYKLQDKLVDTKRVIENIKKTSGEIADNWNAYLKEELYHGRSAKRTQDFLNREMLPILEEMKEKGVTLDQFEEYLHMRHAEERNALVATRNPKMQDQGSGIKTADAVKYLADLTPEQQKTFDSLANKFDKIIDNTQKLLVSSGLETQDTIDSWNGAYEHYVPLMRDDLDFKHHGTGLGSGYSTKGGSSKSAVGSTKKVIDIFANVALQRERAIVRSEKARVGRALYGLVIKNPNPGFWLPINPDAIKNKEKLIQELMDLGLSPEDAENIIQEPKVASIDKKTGLVKYQVNPLMRNSDNVFPVRINGEDRYIFFNTSDPRAIRMVESLKNLDAEQMGFFLGSMGTATRWMASVNTQYNPVFGAWNFIRDVQGAAFNLTTTEIAGQEKKVLDGVFPALRGIYSDLRKSRKKQVGESEWAKLFEQYQLAGGQTGYRDQFNNTENKANIVQRELSKLDRGNVKKAAYAVFNWLSDYNDAMENAVRLSAFKVALDQGISEERAASIAKNLTVNFNRKGAATPTLQTLFAFFNAAVQGSTRLVQTLRGPAGKKIMAGGITIGVFQALALAIAGFDDDDPPEFLKNKNLIIPIPGGDYLIIPMPLGFNIFPGVGRLATEYVLGQNGMITGAKGAGDKLVSMGSLILDAFNPLGSGSVLQMVAPTVVDPWVSVLGTNRDTFGRPISKEDRATSPTPGYTRSRETASEFSKVFAEFLNYVSSPVGTKYTKGLISPTADQIDYLIGQYTGGVGREIMKAGQFGAAVVTGETGDLPSYKVPIVGKLYGETESPAAVSAKFYENVTKLAEHENEMKMLRKNKESTQEYRSEHPEVRFIGRVNNLENQITAINKDKKALQEKDAPEERIKRLDEKKTKLMKEFNDKVKNLERQ